MKALNTITLVLIIIGGLNWGMVGFFQIDVVAAIFGGQSSGLARLIYIVVGLSALWQLVPLFRMGRETEARAQRPGDTRR